MSNHIETPTSKKLGAKAGAKPSREQLIADVTHELEALVLSDAMFENLKSFKKAIALVYPYVQQERRRKKRSKQFRWFLGEWLREEILGAASPVDTSALIEVKKWLVLMRIQLEGGELPQDTGRRWLKTFENALKTRTEPKYWREYQAYRSGKSVAEILRINHPQYDQLHAWEREKYFRKVYNAIKRLVKKYGGPAVPPIPPQS